MEGWPGFCPAHPLRKGGPRHKFPRRGETDARVSIFQGARGKIPASPDFASRGKQLSVFFQNL